MDNDDPLWIKIEDFIYQIQDPSGGIYKIVAKEELNQEQLFFKWNHVYTFCGKPRPKEGEVHMLVV